jgi:hypothetical protein
VKAREIEAEDVTSEMAKVALEPRRGEAEAKRRCCRSLDWIEKFITRGAEFLKR